MKKDSTAWKFITQNLVVTYTLNSRINLEHFSKSISDILISFRRSRSQESNTSNSVQIGSKIKQLWPFDDIDKAKVTNNRFFHILPLYSRSVDVKMGGA